ncbi:chemotaxis protein MotB [Bacillus sp. SORGH_AS 510]|uniref:flagellar motor protein MotB n=1 Tax=Bacillus sp. SORGH_AS_0510 TaxID=3041771 RepID=UPI0027870D6F|nr:flagellar motor protein MotB [Bacillus sp. SORGH_AS_0510]MDQ1146324.1 chemotaxis protein MotB [Bacillus sp. SORGH_AS_0510]
MRRQRRKLEEEHEEHIDESWLIPYADILTLLLALFIVLFASSTVDKAKYESIMEAFKSELTGTKIESKDSGLSIKPSDKESDEKTSEQKPATAPEAAPAPSKEEVELNQLKEQLTKYIKENHLEAVISLTDTKRGVEISLKDVILFDPGKADLKQSSYQTLDVLVGLSKTVDNPISIEGHTDNVPIKNTAYASNWELSSARAVSVLHFFETKSILKDRLQFVGYGEYKPIYPNDTKEHKQANRRVNIVILRKS